MPGVITNHPATAGLVRHPSTLDINHPASSGATNHPSGFNGNFADLFASFVGAGNVLQSVQTDRGLTYGGTPLAGGTAPVVGTLTGTITGAYVPLLFRVQTAGVIGAGATFNLSVDGGATNIMTNFAPAAGTPFPLTGAATGLSMAWAAGSTLADNTWTGTVGGLADQQTGNPTNNYSQGTAALQPIVTVGLNGNAGILGDGVNDFLASALNLPAPGTTPTFAWAVFRQMSWSLNTVLLGGSSGANGHLVYQNNITPLLQIFNGTTNGGANNGAAVSSWVRGEFLWTNNTPTPDREKLGSVNVNAASTTGNNASTGRRIFSSGVFSSPSNCELLALVYTSVAPSAAQLIAADAAATSKYGVSVGV